jgi:hypothetical protein
VTRKRFIASIAVALAVVAGAGGVGHLAAPAALAGGNGAQTFTQTFHNATSTQAGANPCTGATGTFTLTYNGVFHGTINANGSWFTGTMTGDFLFVPDIATQPTYTGHFTSWFGDENNPTIEVQHSTFTIHGTGSDGSTLRFHETAHANLVGGTLTLSFDKVQCG